MDNHDDVVTHLETDIMERKVNWALGNITTNNTRGSDGIPAEVFQILKVKYCGAVKSEKVML